MSNGFDLSIISVVMPILIAVVILVVAVVLIVVNGKTKQAQSLAVSQKAFEELARELRADHAAIKSELAAIGKDTASIKKMMEEIE